MKNRVRERVLKMAPVLYRTSTNEMGEGTLLDIHESGAKVVLDLPAVVGTYIRLAIVTSRETLLVDLAKVQWVQDRTIGVEFIRRPGSLAPYIADLRDAIVA